MGRYVTGDFEWKFAVGDQGSSLGEVLEGIFDDAMGIGVIRTRGIQTEEVELIISDVDEYNKILDLYLISNMMIKGHRKKTPEEMKRWSHGESFGREYWDWVMMKKFKKMDFKVGIYNFDVEY